MNEPLERPPISIWSCAAVLTAIAAFYISTGSPFVLIIPVLYISSFVLPYRSPHDAASIWGLRLLVYTGFALLGRAPTGVPGYFVDAQAFTTAGLIAGGELVLQAYRKPPEGALYNPMIVSLSGIIFLIACNSNGDHIWFFAPAFMVCLLFSLTDLRPRSKVISAAAVTRRSAMIFVAVLLGAGLHQVLWGYRASLMTLSARLLSSQSQISATETPGVSNNPQLSSSFAEGASTTRLIRIQGKLNDPHLRAAAFDTYENSSWGPPITSRFSPTVPLQPALPTQTREEITTGVDRPINQADAKLTVLQDTGGVLFAPLNVWALLPDPKTGQTFDWDRYQGPFAVSEPAPITYYVINSKQEKYGFQVEQGPLCVAPDDDPTKAAQREAALLTVPRQIDPDVRDLALRITKKGKTQSEKASMIVSYLLNNNAYSLNFAGAEGDPISEFILKKRAAHCQFFASATVIMLREIGIPARYASGYFAHEVDPDDGSIIVRGRDAHAWAEAYLKGMGWVTLDATPFTGRADPKVSPSPFYQKTLEKLEDQFAKVRAWFGNLTQFQIMEIVLGVLGLWGLERWRQARKKARKLASAPDLLPEFARVARRFERLLAKRGIKTEMGRPWSEAVPEELTEEQTWIEDYNRARFDESVLTDIQELERELKQLEKTKGSLQKKEKYQKTEK